MSQKVLEVTLPGPEGMAWTETYDAIAKARIAHYLPRSGYREGSEEYKRLEEMSNRDEEVINWARLHVAPEKIRRSWMHCKVMVKNAEGEIITGIMEPKTAQDPRIATLEAENAKLKADLAKASTKGK